MSESKNAFAMFDKEGTGFILTIDIGKVMKSLGHNPTGSLLADITNETKSNDNTYFKLLINQVHFSYSHRFRLHKNRCSKFPETPYHSDIC